MAERTPKRERWRPVPVEESGEWSWGVAIDDHGIVIEQVGQDGDDRGESLARRIAKLPDLERSRNALVEALEEAKRWMPGWGSGTPDSRGAVCETVYDAHAMVRAALKLGKGAE